MGMRTSYKLSAQTKRLGDYDMGILKKYVSIKTVFSRCKV